MSKLAKWMVVAGVLILIVAQFFPPDRTNPPVNPSATFEAVAQPSAELAAIVKRACYNCHSNATTWPWYSRVAPVSWLVVDDVRGGRAHLNFSEWGLLGADAAQRRLEAACAEAKSGDMPLWQYRLMHREAQLSDQDIQTLCGAAAK
jgi:hypothetical protein